MSAPTSLTLQQKLDALGARFYSHLAWTPKAGDYYTSSRADLELYRVVKIEGGKVFTEYCTSPGNLADWPESEFTSAGFGPSRVWVPEWVLKAQSPEPGGWQPMEPAPKDGTYVLGWDGRRQGIIYYEKTTYRWCIGWGTFYPTHWQPMQTPPTKRGGA